MAGRIRIGKLLPEYEISDRVELTGPKERLLVVEVADQQLLVGMTATGVQTLHVFEKPVCATEKVTQPAGFASRLRSAFEEIGK